MIKRILACTDGSRGGDAATAFGIELAQKCQATLTGLHVLDSRVLEGPLMADISGWIGAQPYGNQLQQFREVLEEKGQAIIQSFDERCTAAGCKGARGIVRMGHPSRVILDEESDADLVILGRHGIHADMVGEALGSTAERVVRHSEKPCMVTPSEFTATRKMLLAYDGSEHARHALQTAVALSQATAAELIILTVAEEADTGPARKLLEEALATAEQAGIKGGVPLIAEARHAADAIQENTVEQGCDLIVMGTYGHNRIREMILGSTTTRVTTHAQVPVLLVR